MKDLSRLCARNLRYIIDRKGQREVEIRNFRSIRIESYDQLDRVSSSFSFCRSSSSQDLQSRVHWNFKVRPCIAFANMLRHSHSIYELSAFASVRTLPSLWFNPRLSFRETRCTINNDKRASTELPVVYRISSHSSRSVI